MRILHMIPDIGISNGVMSVILNFAKAMPEDITFDVVYFSEKAETRQADIEALGGRVYKIDSPSPKDLITTKMNSFFEKHKNEWSALHIHCPHFAVFIAPYAKKAGIDKIAVHCHTTEFSLKGNGKRNRLLSLYAKYFIKTKFACSKSAGDMWYGGKEYTVLNNAIDCEKYSPSADARENMRRLLGIENAFVVGHIGKTDIPQKNHKFILKVFSSIKKQNKDAVLLLIGAQSNDELDALCNELEIANSVKFLGIRRDVAEILQACDVFLFPSTSEGLPVSVIEAQAAGLDVIMSDSITSEVAVTDSVRQMSLDKSADDWAKACIAAKRKTDSKNVSLLKSAGWDINECAKKLALYYKNQNF